MKHIPTENLKYFFEFIEQRQKVFWNKINGVTPLTDNLLLQTYKFTNTYRAADRVSQYLLRNVIYNGKQYSREDMFWRILIFRHFNLPKTWEYLLDILGDITSETSLEDLLEALKGVNGKVYNNAYLLTCPIMQKQYFLDKYGLSHGLSKYQIYLTVYYYEFFKQKKLQKILNTSTIEEVYTLLFETTTFADFLAMQLVDDLMWSEIFDFPDNTFIRASLGSVRGINRTFTMKNTSSENYAEVIHWIYANFEALCKQYNCNFKALPGRPLGLMDIQNCFCETDKYMRGLGIESTKVSGKRIKQKYTPTDAKIIYIFPPKWNIPEIGTAKNINQQKTLF